MTTSLNSVVEIVDKITTKKSAPCKKTLQKIVYLIEQKGADLGFDYGIHFYGPYSAALDYSVQQLCADGLLKTEYRDDGHIISKLEDTPEQTNDTKSREIIEDVVNEFGGNTPSDLELLSTSLFVANHLESKTRADIISGVEKIKGSKYSKEKIDQSIDRLIENQFFTLN